MMRMCWIPEGEFLMGSQVAGNCKQLTMHAADGKHHLTFAAATETVLRLVQSVPSPKGEPHQSSGSPKSVTNAFRNCPTLPARPQPRPDYSSGFAGCIGNIGLTIDG
jgi:hypothetical protein